MRNHEPMLPFQGMKNHKGATSRTESDLQHNGHVPTSHRIILGDSRYMREVADEEVHLVVTSPPYVTSKLRKGQPFAYDEYLGMVRQVFAEVFRVLCPDGRFCLNIADIHTKYYYRNGQWFYRVPVGAHLLQICLNLEFILLDTFIWDKGFNRHKGGAPGPFFGSYPYPATIYNNVYWEYVHVLLKPGAKRKVSAEIKKESKLSYERWRECVQKIWRVESETEWIKEHPSVFPVEIPKRFIELYSFIGDVVLDPFLGSGTTTLAAQLTDRHSIGYEINPTYLDLMKRRVGLAQLSLGGDTAEFAITTREDAQTNLWA